MENILVNLIEENEDIRGCFSKEIVSLDKILDVLDEKVNEIKELKMIIKELETPYNPEEDFMYIAKRIKEDGR